MFNIIQSLSLSCMVISSVTSLQWFNQPVHPFEKSMRCFYTNSILWSSSTPLSSWALHLTKNGGDSFNENQKPPKSRSVKKKENQERLRETRGPFGEEFAIATTDTSFKQMLSLSVDNDQSPMQSFLNSFIPQFTSDPIREILDERHVSLPVLKRKGQKQTFMDLHVATQSGMHYIIEMQAQRHEQFKERGLFYAGSTYSNQLRDKDLKSKEWYRLLRPTIALQILDFDTNRAQGNSGIEGRDRRELVDKLYERSKTNPLPIGQYIKDYTMTCAYSKQTIGDLRMIQVELSRSPAQFPPHMNFTETDWWLSLLRYSDRYSHQRFEELKQEGLVIPQSIQSAFHRLEYAQWDPQMQIEYKEDIRDRENFKTTLLTEFAEGEKKGREEGKIEGEQRGIEIAEQRGIEIGEQRGIAKAKRVQYIKKVAKRKTDEQIMDEMEITQSELDDLKAEFSK
jgi:hypothetical protein